MADNPEFEENNGKIPQPRDSEENFDAEDQQKAVKEKEKEQQATTIAELFRAILSTIRSDNGGPEDKIFATVIEAVTDATAKNKNPNKAIAEALSIFLLPEKSTNDLTGAEDEERKKTNAVFDIILHSAEAAHLQPKEILDELAGIEREKQDQLPRTNEDRYEAFEQQVKTTLSTASKKVLQGMYDKLEKLCTELTKDTSIDEKMYDRVLNTKTLLAEFAEVKEDKATREFLDLQEQEFDRQFAQVIVTVFGSAAGARFGNLTAGKDVNLRKEEQQRADHLIKLLLAGNDLKAQKEELVAALLMSYPVEGTAAEQHEATAMRKRIMGYAKLAGLDEEAIVNHQVVIEAESVLSPTTELVNDLESVPSLNAFERTVERQITNASAERVREIQDTWRELLKSVDPNSETASEAREAIAVLEQIIKLKELQAARARGEEVDISELIHPDDLPNGAKEAESASWDRDKKNKELAKLLTRLFSSMRKERTQDDYALVAVITDFILASEKTKAEKEKLLAEVTAFFPEESNAEDLPGQISMYDYLQMYAGSNQLEPQQLFADERTPRSLQQLLEDVLVNASKSEIETLKTHLGIISDMENPPEKIRGLITRAIGLIDNPEKPTRDALQRPVEKPTAKEIANEADIQKQFAKDIRELVMQIDPEGQIQSSDKLTLEILLTIVAYPDQRARGDSDAFSAEKKIAELLAAFEGHEGKSKLTKTLASYSYDLQLNTEEVDKEVRRLLAQQKSKKEPFSTIEQLVQAQVRQLTPAESTRLQEQFTKLLKKIESDSPMQATVQEAASLLEAIAGTTDATLSQEDVTALSRAKNIIHFLEESPNMPKDFPELMVFVDDLTEKLKEGMTSDQMIVALDALNQRVDTISSQLKREIRDDGESTVVRDRVQRVVFLETSIDDYRKLLIREINKDNPQEPETVPGKLSSKIASLVTTADEITSLTDHSSLNESTLGNYIETLESILPKHALTQEQLESIYAALLTQDAVVRRDLELEGKFEKLIELADRTRAVQMELYAQMVMASAKKKKAKVSQKQLVMANANGDQREVPEQDALPEDSQNESNTIAASAIGNIEKTVGSAVRSSARSRGDNYLVGQRMLGPTVVEPPSGSRDAGARYQLGQAIGDIRSVSTSVDPSWTDSLKNVFPHIATEAQTRREVFANPSELEDRVARLSQLMGEAYAQGVNPASLSNVVELANALRKQREEIAVMEQMYKGRNDERTYPPEDEALYEGYVHTALGERIKRIQIELEIRSGARTRTYVDSSGNTQTHEVRTDEELIAYYTELRKWAKILLKNDVRNNSGNAGKQGALNLSNERYKRYSDILAKSVDDFDLSNSTDAALMLSNVNYMFDKTAAGGDFLRHFMRNTKNPKGIDPEKHDSKDFNPDELLGIDYRHAEGTSSFGLPKSLEDTCAIIARQYSNEQSNYKTGGNRELIDGEGNFKFNNFYYWIREQINADVLYNKDGQINPMQKINLKGDASSVSLAELLILVPEYLSQRNFEIQVDKDGDIVAGWGRQTEHSEFTWEQAQQLGAEVEFRQMTHEVRIQYVQASLAGDKGKFLQLMEALHKSNHWVRANNIMWLLGLPSAVTNGTQEIMDVIGPKETQGTLGKAISDMLVGYSYINEIAKYYETPDAKVKGGKRLKTFNENMFYRFWEPNGANKFLTTMAEEALNGYDDAKRVYGTFIQERLREAASDALSKVGGDTVKQEKINQQLQNQIKAIQAELKSERNVGLSISFTKSKHLADFMRYTQREVLGNKKYDDKTLQRDVSENLLKNLKKGFFTRLADMQIYELDKTDKGKDRPDTYLFLRAKNNKVRFGDIKLDGGQKMEDFLMQFDPDQIRKFNYSNNANDPSNPFRSFIASGDEAGLRRAMDTFMDERANPGNYKLFRHNEKMMLAFLKHVKRIDRGWLNHFRDIPENEEVKNMEKRAMEECVQLVHGIDSVEATYAWWQARDYIYIWGIGDWLDDTGIGFRMGGKLFHTGKWRAHRGGKDGGGNPHTYAEIGAVALPFLHTIQIHDLQGHQELGHQSIFSLLQGGHGYKVQPRALRSFKPRSRYSIAHDSEELYVSNMLSNAADLVDLLSTTEVDFTKIVTSDPLGNIVFDYGKARELFKKWRKAIRYAYQKNGLDYREKIWVDGQEKTLFEYFFGPKTRALAEVIRKETGKSLDVMFRDTADPVMATIIAAEIYEHRKMHASGHHWTIENVIELEQLIREFMQEWDLEENKDRDPEVVMKENAFTRKVFRSALKAYHTSYQKMYLTELNATFWSSLFYGITDGLKAFLKGKWIY